MPQQVGAMQGEKQVATKVMAKQRTNAK